MRKVRIIKLQTHDDHEAKSASVELRIGGYVHYFDLKKESPLWQELKRVIDLLQPQKP